MTRSLTELILRAIALTVACGIIGYVFFVLAMWVVALVQIGAWIFVVLAEGLPGG